MCPKKALFVRMMDSGKTVALHVDKKDLIVQECADVQAELNKAAQIWIDNSAGTFPTAVCGLKVGDHESYRLYLFSFNSQIQRGLTMQVFKHDLFIVIERLMLRK